MSEPIMYTNSDNDDNDLERRKKAGFQLTVYAVITEPAYDVSCDSSEQQVIVEIRERAYGDSIHGDDAVMHLRFGTPSTLLNLGQGLLDAGHALAEILVDSSGAD
jgi:hypothetical protein